MASTMLRLARKSSSIASKRIVKPVCFHPIACISTSKKNKDVVGLSEPTGSAKKETWQKEVEAEVEEKTKNWMSYGYSITDRDSDQWWHMNNMFLSVTLGIIGGAFILAYMPDYKMRDWVHREAFLELARREKEGLPLVDKDYIPADQIQLPSDEELGEFEIVL